MSGIYLTDNFDVITEQLKYYSISVDVYKELKEPILYNKGDTLLFNSFGILLFNNSKLKILYINKKHRNNGHGSNFIKKMLMILNENGIKESTAIIPVDKFSFYNKNGFTETKRFVNYIKVKKVI